MSIAMRTDKTVMISIIARDTKDTYEVDKASMLIRTTSKASTDNRNVLCHDPSLQAFKSIVSSRDKALTYSSAIYNRRLLNSELGNSE